MSKGTEVGKPKVGLRKPEGSDVNGAEMCEGEPQRAGPLEGA